MSGQPVLVSVDYAEPEEIVITVRVRVTVYADVNLATGEVVRVFEDDESVRLDFQLPEVALDGSRELTDEEAKDVVEASYLSEVETIAADEITGEIARKAIAIADGKDPYSGEWPAWER